MVGLEHSQRAQRQTGVGSVREWRTAQCGQSIMIGEHVEQEDVEKVGIDG